ncbi:hypothetical protein pb186bvf_006695 [Paramecium bursaria]
MMFPETDSQFDSSLQRQPKRSHGTRSQPARGKMYDDQNFKEVVKNFYSLIIDINKSIKKYNIKKKAPPPPPLPQQPAKKPPRRQVEEKPQQRKQELYNFKNNQQLLPPQTYITPDMMEQIYNYQFIAKRPQNPPQFRRNSYHIAISYSIYTKIFGNNQIFNQDPTQKARIKMQDTKKQNPVVVEEEKEEKKEEKIIPQDDRKKPLNHLVQELQSEI